MMSTRAWSRSAVAIVAALALGTAGCGHSGAKTSTARPSAQAKLVCGDEAAGDIATALGVRTSQAPSATWVDQLYSCRYAYPSASFVVSVKDLASGAAATTFFEGRRSATTGATDLPGVGQAAFAGPDGSAVVRKDDQVMTVDVSGLPATFGVPPHVRSIQAITVATVILDCWTEN